MRKLTVLICFSLLISGLTAQDLKYYLPDSVQYDPAIPVPRDVIFHEVGEWHVTHDRLVNYMRALATAAPARIKLENMGFTYEGRPQVLLIITSPANQRKLEEIRKQHVQLSDPTRSGSVDIEKMPIVVWIGHSIHGNEPSGANASLLTAYYLAAAQGAAIDDLLENVVVLFDPSFNPDGLQRFSTWVNQHKSKNLVSDPNSREFNEVWPGGRFNHYWFDLNRDWLPAVHVESQNRLRWFHLWKPNILTDHHEQGSNATFFFQPGVPSRVNPLTPAKNQELTGKLAKFHARYLDRIGSLYFTKENYDDFYYGKGSTYPDVNGGIGILFEQASSRGHLQQTSNGMLSFPFTIRNQFVTALSTLEGARSLRKEFLSYQRDFYKDAMSEQAADPVKAWVFGSGNADKARTKLFYQMLGRHGIKAYFLKGDLTVNNIKFGSSDMIVPMHQDQYRLIRTIFERTTNYKDSLFYDITSWTMPLAFGLNSAPVAASQYKDDMLDDPTVRLEKEATVTGGKSNYGYLVQWTDFNAPAALYELLQNGVTVKAATTSFQLGDNNQMGYAPGTLFIPASMQTLSADRIYDLLSSVTRKYDLRSTAISGGSSSSGVDMGSSKFNVINKPSIAMLVGTGVNATDAGEIWHLLDQRMNIPVTHLETSMFNRIELNRYNTIILPGGSYNDLNKDKLRAWVQSGGTLVVMEEAITWAAQNGISDIKFKRAKSPVDSAARVAYTEREQIDGAQQLQGAIFGAEADLTHPLAFGYTNKTVSLFKANRVFMEKSRNPFATPFIYGGNPLQSGWVSRENSEAIKNSAAVIVNTVGNGRVINIADNPNFRAFWLGGTKLFMNSLFFGRLIDAASARTDE